MTIKYLSGRRIQGSSATATGGTITTVGTKTIHTFTEDGTFTSNGDFDVEYLVIAGGGGGGGGLGGGGGAGGYRTAENFGVTGQDYTITVGDGGAGAVANASKGSDSVFSTITSEGGGLGTGEAGGNGGSGGSGGGTGTNGGSGGAGTSTDTKPANVQVGSRLEETDTRKMYHYETVPKFSPDDYDSTSGWTNTTGGDMVIDTTNKGVTYTDVNVGDTGIGRAIGTTLSNSKWLVQFTFEVADWNTNDTGLVSLTDDHTQGFKVSGLNTVTFMPQGASYWRFVLLSGQTNSYAENPSPNSKFAVNTQYWVDMYRDGTIVKCKVWTNSGRTGTPHWTSNDLTVGSNADDLTGIQHWNETTADIDIGTCWIREVKVYDGVTSVTPATWTMQPTFRDDFSSNSGWVYTGTVSYNASGYQNLNFARNGSNNGCYHDLTTVSDSAWVLRAKLHLTTKSTSSQNSFIGLTNTTSGSNSSQDAIGMFFIAVSNTISAVDCDGQAISAGGNGDVSFTTTNGNDYWVQITRLTPTTMRVEIFDNANYTGTASITINSTIPSGITGLRYIKIENREELSNNSTSDVWTGDDVKFYNGVTSIN